MVKPDSTPSQLSEIEWASAQAAMVMGQRGWKRHPEGGWRALGTSPVRTISAWSSSGCEGFEVKRHGAVIETKVGEAVQFNVSSADTQHHFVVEPLGIDVEVPPKSMHESVTTKVVTPTEAGTFRIFCSVHARMPMEGTLVVSEAKP